MNKVQTNWFDNAPLYLLMLMIIVFGFLFAEPASLMAAFTVAVFLFWIVGVYRFASRRQARLECIQALQLKSKSEISPSVLDEMAKDMEKPFWAIL